MEKLDKKDKLILYELDRNARQPLSAIAKKANLSRESILYRLKRYLSAGIIRNYLTVVDMPKLGYSYYKVYVKLHNITEKEEKSFIQSLCKNYYISWVASCDGEYSLIFGAKAKDLLELNSVLKEISGKYWKFILRQEVCPIISARHFYRDYLIGAKATTERKIIWGGKQETVKLDEKNLLILDALCENARASAVEISRKVKLSPDSVLQRIKQLEKSGIIGHYMLWPDVAKLKGIYYKVLVSLHSVTEEKEKELAAYCHAIPNIVYMVNTLEPWQLEMDIEVESVEEFRKLIREFMARFADIVSDYKPLSIYREYKFRFFERV
ncbi:MAG: Lrp/AsnC family transcriptional regulator [Nanoarchaeota archaeon]|nr:Lrp/AsnC family transcriptional regulator [Nanoarchaeota archaeon]